ncbi:hypothetical protein L208DRAFT_1378105 [Tricholoma matsutake]|nr:hypothetical protein L208DRAFT_1378105 [Tricholoma matsutake 945]
MSFRKDLTLLRSLPWLSGTILQSLDPYPEWEPVELVKVVTTWLKYEQSVPLGINYSFVLRLDIPDWMLLTSNWVVFMTQALMTSHLHLVNNSPLITSLTGNALQSQMAMVYWRSTRIRVNKFLINIEVAALFLSYLFKGRLDFPDTLAALTSKLSCSLQEFEGFMKRLDSLSENTFVHKLEEDRGLGEQDMDIDSTSLGPRPETNDIMGDHLAANINPPTTAVSLKGKGSAKKKDDVHRSPRKKMATPASKPDNAPPHKADQPKSQYSHGSAQNPIDLMAQCLGSLIEEPLLWMLHNPTTREVKHNSPVQMTLYDHLGEPQIYRASMHREMDVAWYQRLHQMVVANYVDELPLHVKQPAKSAFHIIHVDQFNALTAAEVQEIFQLKHILVHGLPDQKLEFDENGLETLVPPSRTFTIQGK